MDWKGRSKAFFFDTLAYIESPKDIQIHKNINHENWLKKKSMYQNQFHFYLQAMTS